ncbi:MAG: hypothetical protein ACI86S_001079 [Paracoccaceae bacterium]|jgi:hypothetical protein
MMGVMRHCVLALAAMATPVLADQQVVPSGYVLSQFETIHEEAGNVWRYRYQSNGLTLESYGDVADDFLHLCEAYILPSMIANGQDAGQIVISIADREVPFGATDPDAVQFFEAFSVENATCIWEDF